jgi:hypothetical protein
MTHLHEFWVCVHETVQLGSQVISRNGLFTWEDLESFLHSVNRIVVKQQVGKHGKVVIKQCWDSELLTFICFSTLQQLMGRFKLSLKKKK